MGGLDILALSVTERRKHALAIAVRPKIEQQNGMARLDQHLADREKILLVAADAVKDEHRRTMGALLPQVPSTQAQAVRLQPDFFAGHPDLPGSDGRHDALRVQLTESDQERGRDDKDEAEAQHAGEDSAAARLRADQPAQADGDAAIHGP